MALRLIEVLLFSKNNQNRSVSDFYKIKQLVYKSFLKFNSYILISQLLFNDVFAK